MAHDNEPQKTSEVTKKSDKRKLPANNTHNKLISAGALLIALGSLGLAVYTLSLNQQLQSELANKNQQLSAQVEKLTQKQEYNETKIAEKLGAITEIKAEVQSKIETLNKQLQNALSQKFYQNQNWLLLKVRYYMELAQINAHWSKNFDVTAALLQQADELLSQLSGPRIFDIRQIITKEIAQLNATPVIDIAGILSQLDAAQTSVSGLTLFYTLNDLQPATDMPKESSSESIPAWHLRLQDSIKLLNKLVIIRRNDGEVKPLISPAMEALSKESVYLNLQEAQWAVLHNNNEVYHLVLNQAINLLKKNFNEHAHNTSALIKKLNELQQIQLKQERPKIGAALPLLNELINSKAPLVKNESQGGDES